MRSHKDPTIRLSRLLDLLPLFRLGSTCVTHHDISDVLELPPPHVIRIRLWIKSLLDGMATWTVMAPLVLHPSGGQLNIRRLPLVHHLRRAHPLLMGNLEDGPT